MDYLLTDAQRARIGLKQFRRVAPGMTSWTRIFWPLFTSPQTSSGFATVNTS
jgi:hypothetical protein